MQTPGLDHIILTVSNLERSAAFYRDILGFPVTVLEDYGGMFFFETGDLSIWCVAHEQTEPGDRFSEFRVGLDHLAFKATSEEHLQALVDKFRAAGVETTDIETFVSGNKYIVVRDPDNFQIEYWLP